MKRLFFIVLVISIGSITACSPGQSIEPTTTPTLTSTPIPTSTPTPAPTPTPIGGGGGEILFSSTVSEKAPMGNGLFLNYTSYKLDLLDLDTMESRELITKDLLSEELGKELYRTRFSPSPDGTKVLIAASTAVSFGEPDTHEYYIASLDLSSLVPILDSGATAINWIWSPDGSMLLGDALESNLKTLYIINSDGSGLRKLIENWLITSPEWSFDGLKIYYLDLGNPMVIDIDGSNKQQAGGIELYLKQMLFSPDGDRVAYFTNDSELYIADNDFSNAQLIPGNYASESCKGQFLPRILEWSSESQYIIVQTNYCFNIRGQLFPQATDFLIRISDGAPVDVGADARGQHLCGWSPDKTYVYIKDGDEGNQLVLVDVELIGTDAELEISYSGGCPSWIP